MKPSACPSWTRFWWERAYLRLPSITKATWRGIGPAARMARRTLRALVAAARASHSAELERRERTMAWELCWLALLV